MRGIAALRGSLSLAITLLFIFAASRALVHALPGDPIQALLAESGSKVQPEVLRAELGLDLSFSQGLIRDLKEWSQGNLGNALISRQPIAPVIVQRTGATFRLAFGALSLAITLGLLINLVAFAFREKIIGKVAYFWIQSWGALIAALPLPWLGPMLTWLVCVRFQIFPIAGGLLLPVLVLGTTLSGLWGRLIMNRMQDGLQHPSVQAARARGVPELTVIFKYAFLPQAGSLLAFLGTQFGQLLGGAFLAEVIFEWPGLGTLLVDSVLRRDFPTFQAALFVSALFALLGTRLGDLLQTLLDPRQDGSS